MPKSKLSELTLLERHALGHFRPPKRRSDWPFSLELLRLREIELVIKARHGSALPQTDDADIYIRAAALSLTAQDMHDWCRKWAPWASAQLVTSIIAEVLGRRRMPSADGIAGMLVVSMEERTRLKLRTIGACDVTKEERRQIAKDTKREQDRLRQRRKRKIQGRKDRQSYEAESVERLKPWKAVNTSRATWYRKRETGPSRIDIIANGDTPVSTPASSSSDCSPPTPVVSAPSMPGSAGRVGVRGPSPRRGDQGAEPHGNGDDQEAA